MVDDGSGAPFEPPVAEIVGIACDLGTVLHGRFSSEAICPVVIGCALRSQTVAGVGRPLIGRRVARDQRGRVGGAEQYCQEDADEKEQPVHDAHAKLLLWPGWPYVRHAEVHFHSLNLL